MSLLIYGATGYTGRLLTQAALDAGLRPLLGGRSEAKLAPLARSLGLEYRVAAVRERERLDATFSGVRVVLNAAGPFSATASAIVDACLRAGAHYLDVSGEIDGFESLARRDGEARRRGITILPGVGFDVVPSDCLAAHVSRRLPGARRLVLGIAGLDFVSRGSAKSFVEQAGQGVKVRRGGAIVAVPCGVLHRDFDFGAGPTPSVAMSWGDVSSAYHTTGIPDIEVYFERQPALQGMLLASRYLGRSLSGALPQVLMKSCAELLPAGPTDAERAASQTVVVAEAEDAQEAYTFTGTCGPAVAARVLDGDFEPGFQTPARVYGPDFVLGFRGVQREDLS